MARKLTYDELQQQVRELEKEAVERRLAEEALRESDARVHLILQTIPSGLFFHAPGLKPSPLGEKL